MSSSNRRGWAFFVGFLVVALVIGGGISYFASADPDGLDTVTLTGCELDEAGEPVAGTCIAQNAGEHALGQGPLADYSVNGGEGTVGLAGVVGVLVTAIVGGGLFWLLRRRDDAGARQ